ncbi:MAG TPA: MFS transporter [Burkholderiales bacterium]|nr:MFS transporter [Burkholderiales bacterium]
MAVRRWSEIAALGTAQTIAWASSYYLPAILALPVSRELAIPSFGLFAAFSLALLVSAAAGPVSGRLIDRFGGRPLLLASNVVFAAGLVLLSRANDGLGLAAAWVVMGIAMGSGLYDAAFATLVRLHGAQARAAITGITLIAGFASTVGWPLSTYLELNLGWRATCLVWAALNLAVAMPLNALIGRARPGTAGSAPGKHADTEGKPRSASVHKRNALLLAYVFAAGWFISTAMAAHMPVLLTLAGVPLVTSVILAGLVGPSQVVARILEFSFLRRIHPLMSARLATVAHPLGVLVLLLGGSGVAAGFTVLHGLGNGIMTIATGTLPLVLFGERGYGYRQGLLVVPSRLLQAGAPFIFGLLVAWIGTASLWISAALGLSATLALWCIRLDSKQ